MILVTQIAQSITIWALQDDLHQYKSKKENSLVLCWNQINQTYSTEVQGVF